MDPPCRANFYADRFATESRLDAPETRHQNIVMANVPVASLGHGLAAAELTELPNYRAMLAEVFDRLEADPEDFAVFRVALSLRSAAQPSFEKR